MAQTVWWKRLATKPMLVTLLMGFASGMPLLLTLRTLQAWMTESGVNLQTVGIFSLTGLPYTVKFLWAPLMDRYQLSSLGRRRSWLVIIQICLAFAVAAMACTNAQTQVWQMGLLAFTVSFFSASQDVVIDAFRRESLSDADLGMGSTFYYYGYRIAMWVSGGMALVLAQYTSWQVVYLIMAVIIAAGILITLWSDEPDLIVQAPQSLRQAVVEPLSEFFQRPEAWLILAFVLFYKLGDVMAGNMLTPYYLKMGYSKLEIGAIAKTLNLPITLFGGFVGGALIYRWGIVRSLWIFGVLQMLATLSFNLLLVVNHSLTALGTVIIIEDMATSMATASFLAFMAKMTNKKFTATQYALLSSLTGIPRVILSSPTGFLVESLGWGPFYIFCTLIAIPGLILIHFVSRSAMQSNAL